MDILAWNPLSATLITDFSKLPAAQRNYVSIMFTVPSMRELYEDWPSVARTCGGILRREAAENPDEPELAALVGRLSITSDDFRRWWAEHRVAEQAFGAKTLVHPTVGKLRLEWDSFTYAGATRQQLILWSAEEGSRDADALHTFNREMLTKPNSRRRRCIHSCILLRRRRLSREVRHLSHIVFIDNIATPGVVSPSCAVHLSESENHTCSARNRSTGSTCLWPGESAGRRWVPRHRRRRR